MITARTKNKEVARAFFEVAGELRANLTKLGRGGESCALTQVARKLGDSYWGKTSVLMGRIGLESADVYRPNDDGSTYLFNERILDGDGSTDPHGMADVLDLVGCIFETTPDK